MNLGLRCSQMQAERSDTRRMNIIERTALWYRLERIGKSPEEHPEPVFKPPNRDMVLQIKAEVVGWRTKHSELLLELDTLKEKLKSSAKGKTNRYKEYT